MPKPLTVAASGANRDIAGKLSRYEWAGEQGLSFMVSNDKSEGDLLFLFIYIYMCIYFNIVFLVLYKFN